MRSRFFILLAMSAVPWLLASCGDEPPFEYRYLARDVVVIDYRGTEYRLTPEEEVSNLPFTYEFEPDGDLNIVLEGKLYEIDSPYDLDSLKKKKKRRTVKKKSSSSRRRK